MPVEQVYKRTPEPKVPLGEEVIVMYRENTVGVGATVTIDTTDLDVSQIVEFIEDTDETLNVAAYVMGDAGAIAEANTAAVAAGGGSVDIGHNDGANARDMVILLRCIK